MTAYKKGNTDGTEEQKAKDRARREAEMASAEWVEQQDDGSLKVVRRGPGGAGAASPTFTFGDDAAAGASAPSAADEAEDAAAAGGTGDD